MTSREEEAFFRLARGFAHSHARRAGLDHESADECAQAFVVNWLFKGVEPPIWTWPTARYRSYLYRAARNHALNFLRDSRQPLREALSNVWESDDHPAPGSAMPALCFLQNQFWEEIGRGLEALAAPQRTLFVRYFIEENSVPEIAWTTGIAGRTIEQCLFRSRRRLRKFLTARGNTAAELRSYFPAHAIASARFRLDAREDNDI